MVDGWVCWLMCVAEVERLEDARVIFVLREKGSTGAWESPRLEMVVKRN